MNEELRIPPADPEAEMSIIGSILQDKVAAYESFQRCQDDVFYKEANRRIFQACRTLFNHGTDIDIISLADQLSSQGEIDMIGGVYYLTECINRVPSTSNIVQTIKIVKNKSDLRKLIIIGRETVQAAFEGGKDAESLMQGIEHKLYELIASNQESDFRKIDTDLSVLVDKLSAAHENPGVVSGIETGYNKIDQILDGLQPETLYLLAARPSQGKSAFSFDVARNIASRGGKVGIFSHEMSLMQIQRRMLSANTKIDGSKMRLGQLTTNEWEMIVRAFTWMSKLDVWVDDAKMTIEALMAKARRAYARYKFDLIIIDHIGLVSTQKWMENRNNQIGYISSNIKELAKRLKVPILALSQLSRNVENRSDKRPILADLRESGNLEQDADAVMFIHRPETYKIKTIQIGDDKIIDSTNMALFDIAKQRDGALKEFVLYFNKPSATFSEIDTNHIEEAPF